MRDPHAPVAALRNLAGQPEAASQLAVTIIQGNHTRDILTAALQVLDEYPRDEARPALRSLYVRAGRDKGRHDQGGYLRAAILKALRQVARNEDGKMLAQACETYEYWPPDFAEDAVLIRSAGLVALADLDDDAARYQAARILVDPLVARMTGEPAVTAARVLGALGESSLLYALVCQNAPSEGYGTTCLPEVTAECLRQLTSIPATVVERLLEQYAATTSSILQLGLFDLLLSHREGPLGRPYMARFLQETADMDLYRYLVLSIVMAGHDDLLDDLRRMAYQEQRQTKRKILLEAAAILEHRPEFAELAAHLTRLTRR